MVFTPFRQNQLNLKTKPIQVLHLGHCGSKLFVYGMEMSWKGGIEHDTNGHKLS